MKKELMQIWDRIRFTLTGRGTVGDHMQSRMPGPVTRVQGTFTPVEGAIWDTIMKETSWLTRAVKLEELEGTYRGIYTPMATPRRDFINAMATALEAMLPAVEYRNTVMQTEARLAQMLPNLREAHPELWARITQHGKSTASVFEACEALLVDLMSIKGTETGGKTNAHT
jgi:hypothetical protein